MLLSPISRWSREGDIFLLHKKKVTFLWHVRSTSSSRSDRSDCRDSGWKLLGSGFWGWGWSRWLKLLTKMGTITVYQWSLREMVEGKLSQVFLPYILLLWYLQQGFSEFSKPQNLVASKRGAGQVMKNFMQQKDGNRLVESFSDLLFWFSSSCRLVKYVFVCFSLPAPLNPLHKWLAVDAWTSALSKGQHEIPSKFGEVPHSLTTTKTFRLEQLKDEFPFKYGST